jgi:hypothetical protein
MIAISNGYRGRRNRRTAMQITIEQGYVAAFSECEREIDDATLAHATAAALATDDHRKLLALLQLCAMEGI